MATPLSLTGSTPDAARRTVLSRRVQLFVAATITYNVIEAVVAITAGTMASSTALIGFGLDSIIEVSSAAAVAWQFAAKDPETRERTALRFIAWSFFALAAYVSFDAATSLIGGSEAKHSASRIGPGHGPGTDAVAVLWPTPHRPGVDLPLGRRGYQAERCCAPTCPGCCSSGLL